MTDIKRAEPHASMFLRLDLLFKAGFLCLVLGWELRGALERRNRG